MRIGRDHIASTVYTIVFAYAGAALPVLLLINLSQRPLGVTLTSEVLSEELVRTLVGAIGLVLSVPLTTAVGVALVRFARGSSPPAATPRWTATARGTQPVRRPRRGTTCFPVRLDDVALELRARLLGAASATTAVVELCGQPYADHDNDRPGDPVQDGVRARKRHRRPG